MNFYDDLHQKTFTHAIMRAHISTTDRERLSLFYLLTLLPTTREHLDDLYDFANNGINFDSIHGAWQTGSTTKLTYLAFNLYNGFAVPHERNLYEDFHVTAYGVDSVTTYDHYSVLDIFAALDSDKLAYIFEAIQIRLGII